MTGDAPDWIRDHYDGDVPSITEDPSGPIALEGIDPADGMSEAVERAVENMSERLEYELRGAWRAGYDRLDVYDEMPPEPVADERGFGFTFAQYVHPAFEGDPRPDPPNLVYRHSYDFTSVPDGVIRAAVRGELDAEALEDLRR